MKRNFYLLLFFLTFLPFTSCSTDDINLDGEDIYDLDAYFAEWVKETYGQDLEWAYEYLNGTPNVFRNEDRSIFTMGQFKVVDKEGNNLIDQIDTDKVRIYQVINDKEILQEKEIAYSDQVWDTKDVNEDFFSRMTEEQIIDYWKKHNIVGYAEEVTLDETGIITLCSYAGMDFSTVEGLKAYIISSFVPSEGKAVLTRVEEVPEKTGVLLMGNPGTYTIPMSIGETSLANLLVGVTEATNLNAIDGDYTNYALQTDGEAGFYAVTDNFALAANSAYLPLPTDYLPAAARSITFRFNDETEEESTGITSASVTGNKATAIYNLNGQRLTTLQKGLNIVGGKKVFKK